MARQNLTLILYLGVAIAGMFAIYAYFTRNATGADPNTIAPSLEGAEGTSFPMAPITKPIGVPQDELASPVVTADLSNVVLIAGHRGSDSGTECIDGLTEVQINSALAERVAVLLREAGVETDVYDEFDERLDGLAAAAMVSIHADSCDYINEFATGFKISGSNVTNSSALSICMQQRYADATQLAFHGNSITPHMANYHAFRKISPGTPAIIIEVGFLNLDRELLTTGSEKAVEGLVRGVLCYMENRT